MVLMLTRLEPSQYEAVEALYASLRDHLGLMALLSGAVPGHVFADDASRPARALAWLQYRLFAAGDFSPSDLADALEARVLVHARAAGTRWLSLFVAPPARPVLEVGLAGAIQPAGLRLFFERPAAAPTAWRDRMPPGYAIGTVDRSLLERHDLEHLTQLQAEMCSERPSVEAFLRHSFGVCAVRGSALAGWCLSEYNHAGRCEVGIEVLEPHRRQGLATAMTLALVERAAAAGLSRVGWHCYAQNQGSVATARAAGFALIEEYPAWLVDTGLGRQAKAATG